MGKLSDLQIRVWVERGEHFEPCGDGYGLTYDSGKSTRCQAGFSAIGSTG